MQYFTYLFLVLISAVLLGCAEQTDAELTVSANGSSDMQLRPPALLINSRMIVRESLFAEVSISYSGVSTLIPAEREANTDIWRAQLQVPTRTEFTITVTWFDRLDQQRLDLVTASNSFQPINFAGELSIIKHFTNFDSDNFDADSDSVVNLTERLNGTSPFDASSPSNPLTPGGTGESSSIYGSWISPISSEGSFDMFGYFQDGTYMYTRFAGDGETGLEWGNFSRNGTTGRVSSQILFDENEGTGLNSYSDSGFEGIEGVLIANRSGDFLEVAYNDGIESGQVTYSLVPANGILGTWLSIDSSTQLETVSFTANGTYFYNRVDTNTSSVTSGAEIGTYIYDETVGELSATVTLEKNGNAGFSGYPNSARLFLQVAGNVLTLSVDTDGNGESDEDLVFIRDSTNENNGSTQVTTPEPEPEPGTSSIDGIWLQTSHSDPAVIANRSRVQLTIDGFDTGLATGRLWYEARFGDDGQPCSSWRDFSYVTSTSTFSVPEDGDSQNLTFTQPNGPDTLTATGEGETVTFRRLDSRLPAIAWDCFNSDN